MPPSRSKDEPTPDQEGWRREGQTRALRWRMTGQRARITLDRPPLNVLDREAIRELRTAISASIDAGASVLVIESADPRTFSAGVSVQDHAPEVVAETLREFHDVFRALYVAPFVTIAKVRGRCLGGGCELALFCDLVIAADTAEFALPEISLGCFPPLALSAFPYRFGRAAVELVLSGERVSAIDALRSGLVSRFVPRDELDEHVDALAQTLAAKSRPVLAMTVQTMRALWSPGFERSLEEAERTYVEKLVPLADYREGLAAFMEKRAPRFEG